MENGGIQDPQEPEITEPIETSEEPQEPEPQEPIEGEGGGEPPAYEPNFNYKYKDEEFEFDERLRSVVKDKETEEYLRDLFTAHKAHSEYKEIGGVREVQEKLTQFEQTTQDYQELNREIDQLSGLLAMNNTAGFEAFRKHLGIEKDQILQWAIEEAKGSQDPQFAQQIAHQRQMEENNFNLSYQNNLMQNSREAEFNQQRDVELNNLVGTSEVSKAYDNLVGKPGSFKQAVIEHGVAVYNATKDPRTGNGRILSVSEAVQAVEQRFQGLVAKPDSGTNNQGTQNPTQINNDPQNTVVIRQEGKKVLPNVGGGNGSPAKKKLTSLDAIRAHAKTLD